MVVRLFRKGVLLLFCLSVFQVSAQPEELEYAYPDISVWTTERDQHGKLKNPLVHLADELFTKAGIPWHAQDYPAKRMFVNLRTGVSKFSMLVNAESHFQGCCLLSHDPIALVEIRAFYRQGSDPIDSIHDLAGKRVITIQGYSYSGLIGFINDPENKVQNQTAVNHVSAFSMLNKGRAEYLLDYAFPATEVLDKNPIKGLAFSTLKQAHVYLVLHKDYPDAEQVMRRLEEIAATLHKEKYLSSPSLPQPLISDSEDRNYHRMP